MNELKRLWCYIAHRKRHVVIFTLGMPFPFDLFDYEWWCPTCDKGGGYRARIPAYLYAPPGAST